MTHVSEAVAEAEGAVKLVREGDVTHVSADEINLHAVLSGCLSCFGKEFIAQIDSCHDMATLRQFDRMTAVAAWDVRPCRNSARYHP